MHLIRVEYYSADTSTQITYVIEQYLTHLFNALLANRYIIVSIGDQ